MTLKFTLPGKAQSWQRVKRGRYGQSYVPNETRRFESDIWSTAQVAGAKRLMFEDRALWIRLRVFLQAPKRMKRTFPTVPPDIDNFLKGVLDGLKHAFKNDAQVVGILPGTGKFYGEPRVEVELTDEPPQILEERKS